MKARHQTARVLTLGCAVSALVLLASCTEGGGRTETGGGSYVSQVQAQGTRHWTCSAQGLGGNMEGEHDTSAGLANDYYRGRRKGTLTLAQCLENARTFDRVLSWAQSYPTVARAEASGFVEMVQFVEGMGTHHMTLSLGGPETNPFFLQYDGEAPDAPLAGMSWFTFAGARPPAGFAGDNDWWHSHTTLCYTGRSQLENALPGAPAFGVAGNEISNAECQAKGGFNLALPGIWMGHAWIVPGYEYHYDVFAGSTPCVKGEGRPPAPADPCRNEPMEGGGHDH